jgi:hypothetical protein
MCNLHKKWLGDKLEIRNCKIDISKERFNCHSQNLIYTARCEEHEDDFYIGETKQELKKRNYQHRGMARKGAKKSKDGEGGVYDHFLQKDHKNAPDCLTIIPVETIKREDTIYRKFRERSWVEALSPTMNKNVATISLDMRL